MPPASQTEEIANGLNVLWFDLVRGGERGEFRQRRHKRATLKVHVEDARNVNAQSQPLEAHLHNVLVGRGVERDGKRCHQRRPHHLFVKLGCFGELVGLCLYMCVYVCVCVCLAGKKRRSGKPDKHGPSSLTMRAAHTLNMGRTCSTCVAWRKRLDDLPVDARVIASSALASMFCTEKSTTIACV